MGLFGRVKHHRIKRRARKDAKRAAVIKADKAVHVARQAKRKAEIACAAAKARVKDAEHRAKVAKERAKRA